MKRWIIANKIYIGIFILITIFAYIDSKQIIPFIEIDTIEAWQLYNKYTLPSFIALWVLAILIPAIVYYLFSKDKSEAIGIAGAGLILLLTGLEDLLYFVFSQQTMGGCMQYLNDFGAPVAWYSTNILKETCVTPLSLISFVVIGVIISYFVFQKLKRAKW